MTKFITYFNLCPIPEPKDFLGISPDKEEGNIIITLDKNIAIIINISTQRQVRSWTFLEKLSAKVVYDKVSEKYVGVFASKIMRCWDENTTDINKCEKYKFQRSIVDLISNDDHTIVLYTDGSCQTLRLAIENRKEDVLSQQLQYTNKSQFSNAAVHTLPNGSRIVTYFEYDISNEERYLVCWSFGNIKENPSARRFKLKREDLNVHLSGFAVIEGSGSPVLLTIWSDKRVFLLTLTEDAPLETSPGKFASVLTQLKTDCPLSVLGISGHFVAIYGANDGQEGASLLLYNTQYKVIKTKQYFKVYFDFSKLWNINNYIILAMGKNLSAIQYQLLKEILSELIGTQINNECYTTLEDDSVNEEELLEDCLQYNNRFICSKEIDNIRKSLEVLTSIVEADGKTVPFTSSVDFHKKLNELSQADLHVEVLQASNDELIDKSRITLMNNRHDNGFLTPEIQIIATHLEKIGAGEQEITEKLLQVLIKAELIEDIEVCLKRYTNISERMMSKTLQFILKCLAIDQANITINKSNQKVEVNINGDINQMVGHLTNGVTNSEMNMTLDIDADNDLQNKLKEKRSADILGKNTSRSLVERTLNTLLSCSVDCATIASYIRQDIEYREVLIMLEYLYNMLTDLDVNDFEERPTHGHCNNDLGVCFEMQLFRWFHIVLDAHFQKLALTIDNDFIELLQKWHKLFVQYRQEMDQLEDVSALLYYIVECKKSINYSYNPKWYSIEEVKLF